MPVWLQILLGVCAAGTPFILWMLRMADKGRAEMKSDVKDIKIQVTETNGKVTRHDEWIRGHEDRSNERERRVDASISGLEGRERVSSERARKPSRRRK